MQRIDDWNDGARKRDFEAAVLPHLEAMHRAAVRILRSDDIAWDAVQETLIRAWHYDRLPSQPRSVLLSLVRRSCLHILRCARRRLHHEQLASEDLHGPCCSMDPAGPALDPAATAAQHDELRGAREAAARLTREHREVLDLVAWRGLTYREAAETLRLPIGTIRSRASRARAALQRVIAKEVEQGEPC